jgi:MYXO-CTERM domain-containing protein
MIFASLVTLLWAGTAGATAPAEELLQAMEIDRAWIVDGSVSTPGSEPTMFTVLESLGVLSPNDAPTMAVMSTGNTKNITENSDYDYPGEGPDDSAGDHATLRVELQVPDNAHSFSFDFFFLSREYPEWVGEEFNDTFEVWLSSGAFNGQIVFDSAGNNVNVNNGLFTVVYDEDNSPSVLNGTGFQLDGGTGWVTTVAPCVPGERMSLSFEIYDVSDGIWDSAVLLDRFRFSEDEQDDPTSDHTPNDDLALGYISPKEGDVGGGIEVLLHGGGFDAVTTVMWGAHPIGSTSIDSGDVLIIGSIPSAADAGVPDGGNIDVTLERAGDTVTLYNAFTYHADAEGEVTPWITSVLPGSVNPAGSTEMRIRGTGLRPGMKVFFRSEGGEVEATVESLQAAEGGQMATIRAPAHPEGWVDVIVENPSGLRSLVGYPIEVTSDAVDTNSMPGSGGGSTCGSSIAGSAPSRLAFALLALGLVFRRRTGGSR